MALSTIKKVILFVLIGFFYLFLSLLTHKYTCDLENKGKIVLFFCAMFISIASFGLYEILGINDKSECYDYETKNMDMKTNDPNYQTLGEFNDDSIPGANCNNLNITASKLCMGGSYLSQGGTPRGKMCQQLASTPEGQAAIGNVQCSPPGLYVGAPAHHFEYTPVSNSVWANQRCDPPASADAKNNSFLDI